MAKTHKFIKSTVTCCGDCGTYFCEECGECQGPIGCSVSIGFKRTHPKVRKKKKA